MSDDKIYESLYNIIKLCGYYDIKLDKVDNIMYVDNEEQIPIYQLVVLWKNPKTASSNEIVGAYIHARLANVRFSKLINDSNGTPIMVAGNSWQKCKETLEELSSTGMEVMLNETLPLIKSHETFEEAMIRCNLNFDA